MKTSNRSIIKTIAVILMSAFIGTALQSCSGESIVFLQINENNILYALDNDNYEATATGYFVKDGKLIDRLDILDDVTAANLTYRVVGIADRAFVNVPCQMVSIGINVKVIGSGAFSGCSDIATVVINGTSVPLIHDDSFDKNTYENAILMVPNGCSIEGTPWQSFSHISRY